mmetsp:Transcript_127118/g.359799  ORF Transcript_127118/g.359799 Transcript_127118/m.359799 type:complete len:272 (+) Transcript_127118:182-997(+)
MVSGRTALCPAPRNPLALGGHGQLRQDRGCRRPPTHVDDEAPQHHAPHPPRHAPPADLGQLPGEEVPEGAAAAGVEGQARPQHEVDAQAARPDVDAIVPQAADNQFWRAVRPGPAECERALCGRSITDCHGAVEVHQLQRCPILAHEDVGGLDVSVDHQLAVEVIQCSEQLQGERRRLLLVEDPVLAHVLLDVAALRQVHDKPQDVVAPVEVPGMDNGWVLQGTHELVLRHGGPDLLLVAAVHALHRNWLPICEAGRQPHRGEGPAADCSP